MPQDPGIAYFEDPSSSIRSGYLLGGHNRHRAILSGMPTMKGSLISHPRQQSSMRCGELMVLAGMVGAVGSLYFVWEREAASSASLAAFGSSVYTNPTIQLTGFQCAAHWPITVFGIGAGLSLVSFRSAKDQSQSVFIGGVAAILACFASLHWLAKSDFTPLPGTIIALCSCASMIYGSYLRHAAIDCPLDIESTNQ